MEENKNPLIKLEMESVDKKILIENEKIQFVNEVNKNTVLQNDDNIKEKDTASVPEDSTSSESIPSSVVNKAIDDNGNKKSDNIYDNIETKDHMNEDVGSETSNLNNDNDANKVIKPDDTNANVETSCTAVSTKELPKQELNMESKPDLSIIKKEASTPVEDKHDTLNNKAEGLQEVIKPPNIEVKHDVKPVQNESSSSTTERVQKKRSLVTVIDDKNEKESGYVKCGVCGDTFFSKALGEVRKYGVHSCDTCYRFLLKINEYLPKNVVLPLPTRLKCKSTNGLEPCHLPPIRVKVDKKIQTQSHLRCKACWLSKCVNNYDLPKSQKDILIQLLPAHLRPKNYVTPTVPAEVQEAKVEEKKPPDESKKQLDESKKPLDETKKLLDESKKSLDESKKSSPSVTRGSLQQRRKTISESLAEYAKRKYTDDTSELQRVKCMSVEQKLIKVKKPKDELMVIKKEEDEQKDEKAAEPTSAPITSIAEYMKNKYGYSEDQTHNVTREYNSSDGPQTSTPIPQGEAKQESNNAGRVKRKAAMNFMETMKRVKRNMLHGGFNVYDSDNETQVKSHTTPKRPKKEDEGHGLTCGICGNIRLYKYIKQAKKFGLYNCEGCRKFILNSVADMPRSIHSTPSYILPCNKDKGVIGKCNIDWELTYRSNKKKCKACHLARGVLRYKMPFQQKQLLVMMLPQQMRPEIIRQALSDSNTSAMNTTEYNEHGDSIENSKKKVVIVKFEPGWTPDLIQRYKKIILRKKELKSKAPKIKIERTEETTNDSDNEQQMLSGFSEEEITQSFPKGA